jgi:hypothetical protein
MEAMMSKYLKMAISSFLFLSMSVCYAEEGTIRGRVGVSQNNFNSLWSGGELKSSYQSLNLGTTYIHSSGFYGDLGYKTPLAKAKWNTVELTNRQGSLNDGEDEKFTRKDTTFTLGKAFDGGWTSFLGYQDSRSKMDLPARWVSSYGSRPDESFNVNGYFVGGGKSFDFKENGSFSLSGAVGKMKAKLQDSNSRWNNSTGGSGYSLGAGYNYFFDKNIGINLEIKQQKYRYTFSNSAILLTSGDDKMLSYGINLIAQF